MDTVPEQFFPDPEEFFNACLANSQAVVDLALATDDMTLSEEERACVELGASAAITATMDELARRGMIKGQ